MFFFLLFEGTLLLYLFSAVPVLLAALYVFTTFDSVMRGFNNLWSATSYIPFTIWIILAANGSYHASNILGNVCSIFPPFALQWGLKGILNLSTRKGYFEIIICVNVFSICFTCFLLKSIISINLRFDLIFCLFR